MKIVLTVILLLCTAGAFAQQEWTTLRYECPRFLPEREFRFSVGAYPLFIGDMNEWDELPYYGRYNTLEQAKQYRGSTYTAGAFTLSYACCFLKWLDFGISASYNNQYYRTYSNLDNRLVDRYSAHFFSVVPTVRFTWFRHGAVRMYSACGLGLTVAAGDIDKEIVSRATAALQFTGFGIAVGRRWFGYAELGAGVHGVLVGGVGYRFNEKRVQQ